jgi:hypothetical protein
MELTLLKEILDTNPRQKEIKKAIELEQKSMFFTDPATDITNTTGYRYHFLRKIEDRLNNPDSYNNFLNNLTFPLKINEFIDSIYTKIGNIWKGQNPFYDFSFNKDGIEDYFQYTDIDYFKNDIWHEFKTHYNSIIITDLPESQSTERPEPFNYLLKIANVIDVLSEKNQIQHVIFKAEEKLVVIDNDGYQVYGYVDANLGALEIDSKHELNKCPAVWVSQIDFNTKSNIVKSNVISKSLGKIEDLQIIYTLKNILSPYAFYQFIIKYKNSSECEYDDGVNYCDGGYIKNKESNAVIYQSTNVIQKCPLCNKAPGIGEYFGKPIPTSSDEPDLKNVIEFVAPDPKIMEYGDSYISQTEADLFDTIVGTDENLNPKQNHNETAYKYNTEGQQSVIFKWKQVFEDVISDTFDNVLRLRYPDIYESNTIDLGTDFILSDLNTLYQEKKELKELGLEDVFNINESLINARYQNNPEKKRRALIIDAFKPFDEGIKEIEASFKDGNIDEKDYRKQKYLKEFIKWFEANKIKLLQFPQNDSASKIAETLNSYFDDWYNEKFNITIKNNE